MSFLDRARDMADKAAAKPPKKRRGLTGLLVLDPGHPDGYTRGADTARTADSWWANPDALRRKLERGEDL